MPVSVSGASSPKSQSTTLSAFSKTLEKDGVTTAPAYEILESIASKASAAVFVYDLAEAAGIGHISKKLSQQGSEYAPAFSLQTRVGAGLLLAGRLSESTSIQGAKGGVITAYTTPEGLMHLLPALDYLSPPTATSRLVFHIPRASPIGPDFALTPSLASANAALAAIPENFTVLFSSTPQETLDLTAASYAIANAHVVHFFDQYDAAREVSRKLLPPSPPSSPVLQSVTALKIAGYDTLQYFGDPGATNVVVLLNGPLAQAVKCILPTLPSTGLLVIRMLRPWDVAAFLNVLPGSAQTVHVFDDGASKQSATSIYYDVLEATVPLHGTRSISVRSNIVTPAELDLLLKSGTTLLQFIGAALPLNWFAPPTIGPPHVGKKILFFGSPVGRWADIPREATNIFLYSSKTLVRLQSQIDIFSKPGGVNKSVLFISANESQTSQAPALFTAGSGPDVDFTVVYDASLLRSHAVLEDAKEGSGLLLLSKWDAEEVVSNLHPAALSTIQQRRLHLVIFDPTAHAAELQNPSLEVPLAALAFLRLYLGTAGKHSSISNVFRANYGASIHSTPIASIVNAALKGPALIPVIAGSVKVTDGEESTPLKPITFNSIDEAAYLATKEASQTSVSSWSAAAQRIAFSEAFSLEKNQGDRSDQIPNLRPDVPEDTFLVTCTVNRRLTPFEYNRNVFHMEFETSGTGLKYAIGEALGVHGWNDTDEVIDFCQWYGVDPNEVVEMPVAGDASKKHTRTVFQAFQQQIDLFGKPPKSFYEILSAHAKSKEDRMALRFISAPEGSSTFKKLSELETVTFVDVLKKFSSAHPPVEVLCEIVGDIKPRHYSIASAQSVVGDRVDLLVVTVDWVTPSGRSRVSARGPLLMQFAGSPRFGQCTRYLADMKPGTKVTVSIKPSVMKLPPDNMQPIVMAGLGTG